MLKMVGLDRIFSVTNRGLLLHVKATPKAAQDTLGDIIETADQQWALSVKTKAVADKGKANKAIIALIAKHLCLKKAQISLVSGSTSRHKSFLLIGDDICLDTMIHRLKSLGYEGIKE